MPVALVVPCLISVRTVLTHKVGDDDGALTVLSGDIVILPEAFTLPHPPVRGIR